MTALTEDQRAEMRRCAEAATPGPWSNDTADDPDIDFKWQQMRGPDGKVMFDSLNSDTAVIHEEYDEDGGSAWDEIALRNFEHIAASCPANVIALLDEIDVLRRENEYLIAQPNCLEELTALRSLAEEMAHVIGVFIEAYIGASDCRDNTGQPYQSQWAADNEQRAARVLASYRSSEGGADV